MSAEPQTFAERPAEDADTWATRICAQYGLPHSEVEYRAWLCTAWHAGYNAGLDRASRLLDREETP